MKICLLVLCENQKDTLWVIRHVDSCLQQKGLSPAGTVLPVVVMNKKTLAEAIEHGAEMPKEFTQAEAKLMFGIDSPSTAYLEKVSAELEEVRKRIADSSKVPTVLQMHDVILAECRRRALKHVWVQDTSKEATELQLDEKLKDAGLEICDPKSPTIEYDLWRIQAKLADVQMADEVDNKKLDELTNYFRERLTLLAKR